jgi:hypothetical protein
MPSFLLPQTFAEYLLCSKHCIMHKESMNNIKISTAGAYILMELDKEQ